MNDYAFGNYLLSQRERAGMTQSELAEHLGVTNKAVSKWETGRAKPGLETLRKLSAMLHVPVDELLKYRDKESEADVVKIVITGGPCAGKSTAMSWIQNAFTAKGYEVLFVPETATELINGGVAPWTCGSNLDYQKGQMKLQLEKEKVFGNAAASMKAERVLIVCDRGALDNKAYMTLAEYNAVLDHLKTNEIELRDNYDAVFHLVTAETPAQARELDDRLISAWTGHPHLRVIDNSTGFEEKMKRLIAEISNFLGEPEPYEIERRFLIEYPDIAGLEADPNCRRVEIIQTYLRSEPGVEVRIRQRGADGQYIYYKTVKKPISDMKRIEIEERLSQAEYLSLMMEADTSMRQIRKTRFCLTYEGQYFEIDVYPFWQDKAIAEIELGDEEQEISFPKFLKVIREVTGEEKYKNSYLAKL